MKFRYGRHICTITAIACYRSLLVANRGLYLDYNNYYGDNKLLQIYFDYVCTSNFQ